MVSENRPYEEETCEVGHAKIQVELGDPGCLNLRINNLPVFLGKQVNVAMFASALENILRSLVNDANDANGGAHRASPACGVVRSAGPPAPRGTWPRWTASACCGGCTSRGRVTTATACWRRWDTSGPRMHDAQRGERRATQPPAVPAEEVICKST